MQESITFHVGKRIKMYRKKKGLTIDQLSTLINKSRATVSKYENGNISVDIETLLDISIALNIDVSQLVDFKWKTPDPERIKDCIFSDCSDLYLYYYDGRAKKLVKSLIQLIYNESAGCIDASLYLDVPSFEQYDKCRCVYLGQMKPFDTIIYFILDNQSNHVETVLINLLNPLEQNTYIWGLLNGIYNNPISPVTIKVLFTRKPLLEREIPIDQLFLTKEDFKSMKQMNMFTLGK